MANERLNGRWVLDTPESVVAAGTAVRIQSISFVGSDDVYLATLHDGNAKEIWKCAVGDISVCGNEKNICFGKDGIIVDGLDLDSISSGSKMYVYLAKL